MVSFRHPFTPFYLKSLQMLRNEEKRHLLNYYRMIHPFSMFIFSYNIWMFIVLSIDFFVSPLILLLVSEGLIQKAFSISNLSHLVLACLSMCTGYYDQSKNFVILRPRNVIVHYLRTYFIFDFLALSVSFVRTMIVMKIWDRNMRWVSIMTWILPTFKLGRYIYYIDILKQIALYSKLNNYIYHGIKSLMHFILFLEVTHYVLYNIMQQFEEFKDRTVLACGKSALEMIMLVSHGMHQTHHVLDRICPILFLLLGFLVQLLLYTNVMQLWHKFYSTENKQLAVYDAFSAYMRYKALPIEKRERIFLYLDFKYQKHFYKDTSITKATSEGLRKEILLNASKESTQKVELFQKLPPKVMRRLRTNLISEIYLPGDVIIKAGTTGKCMFFILAGTVVITTPLGQEVCFLRDGAHFGEIALVVNIARVANVIAITPCELFKLNRRHFLETVENFPDLMEDMINMATKRIANTQSISDLHNNDQVVQVNILHDETDFDVIGEDSPEPQSVNEYL